MARKPKKTIEEVVVEVGRYPIEAYQLVRDGLTYTVDHVHGQESPMARRIHKLMQEKDLDFEALDQMLEAGELPDAMARYLREKGGAQAVNRHVSGDELCWGLRDLALEKWGLLASTVLRGWNIASTADFGRIVFALVENGFLQKQPHDTLKDFQGVYDFEEAFDKSFQLGSAED